MAAICKWLGAARSEGLRRSHLRAGAPRIGGHPFVVSTG